MNAARAVAATVLLLLSIPACFVVPGETEFSKSIIDVHVHSAGIGAGDSGCFASPTLRNSYKFKWYLRAFGVDEEELQQHGDGLVIERISARVHDSRSVAKVVILAIDGVIDADGELDKARTQVYVPNAFVAAELSHYDNLLFGASVNPYRRDAVQCLIDAKTADAVLVKWIPAIMAIDPADVKITEFYAALVELELPLLVHVGQERSFGDAQDEFGDPARLSPALDLGVTVIAAHIATTGKNAGEGNFERLLPMFERYPNLYTEISSLTQINKLGFLTRALAVPGIVDRMIYGSDWPLQFFLLVSPWYQVGRARFRDLREVSTIKNQWDRDVALKRAMGVPSTVFERTTRLLNIR